MFKDTKAFSSFSVDDVQKAKKFYGQTLGLEVSESYGGRLLEIHIAGGKNIVIYPLTVNQYGVNLDIADSSLTVIPYVSRYMSSFTKGFNYPAAYEDVVGTEHDRARIIEFAPAIHLLLLMFCLYQACGIYFGKVR